MQNNNDDRYLLAIDQGTTSTRALIFNARGEVQAIAQKPLELITPQSGWVEQDARAIWADTVSVCAEVMDGFSGTITAIGITNQRETTILWDKISGDPVHNAIVWQDRRTAEHCENLKEQGYEALVARKTGLLLDPYFSATKIGWILDRDPSVRARAEAGEILFGTVESYLIWKLSGSAAHKSDYSNAARTMLMDVHEGAWDKDLCDLFKVPMAMLPELSENTAYFADVMAAELPTLQGVPIHGCAGDQQAALFGQACFEPGMVKSTYGTGCFALMNTGAKSVTSDHKLLSTIAWNIGGKMIYALDGSIFVAGAAIQFLRDNLGLIEDAAETEALANAVEDTDGAVFVPALTGLGAPYWDPHARGALFGLSRGTKKEHIVRAALDAQAYQSEDLMGAMRADYKGSTISEMRIDGGLVKNDYVAQRLADITGLIIRRPVVQEATAWGAASMAGLGCGLYNSTDEIAALWSEEKSFVSSYDQSDRKNALLPWHNAVRKLLA